MHNLLDTRANRLKINGQFKPTLSNGMKLMYLSEAKKNLLKEEAKVKFFILLR